MSPALYIENNYLFINIKQYWHGYCLIIYTAISLDYRKENIMNCSLNFLNEKSVFADRNNLILAVTSISLAYSVFYSAITATYYVR